MSLEPFLKEFSYDANLLSVCSMGNTCLIVTSLCLGPCTLYVTLYNITKVRS